MSVLEDTGHCLGGGDETVSKDSLRCLPALG